MCSINFIIVYVAYNVFGARNLVLESQAWLGLSAVTSLLVISGSIAFSYVPKSHKHTFCKQRTLKEHLATFHWDEIFLQYDAKSRRVRDKDRDGIRALMVLWISPYYLPKEKLIELYRNNWNNWCADPPHWFDEEFKSLVPRDLLVGVDKKLWGDKTKLRDA